MSSSPCKMLGEKDDSRDVGLRRRSCEKEFDIFYEGWSLWTLALSLKNLFLSSWGGIPNRHCFFKASQKTGSHVRVWNKCQRGWPSHFKRRAKSFESVKAIADRVDDHISQKRSYSFWGSASGQDVKSAAQRTSVCQKWKTICERDKESDSPLGCETCWVQFSKKITSKMENFKGVQGMILWAASVVEIDPVFSKWARGSASYKRSAIVEWLLRCSSTSSHSVNERVRKQQWSCRGTKSWREI